MAGSGPAYNHDQWDGYRASRRRVLEHIAGRRIDNVVFLTGDMHSSWACDIPLDPETYPASRSVAIELVGTSVTSDNLDEILRVPPRSFSLGVEQAFRSVNRHIKLLEFDSHGYSVVGAGAHGPPPQPPRPPRPAPPWA